VNGTLLSVPVISTYASFFLFGGEFPGHDLVARISAWGHTLALGNLIPLGVGSLLFVALGAYPFIESWVTGDDREHHLLDRPRNRPVRALTQHEQYRALTAATAGKAGAHPAPTQRLRGVLSRGFYGDGSQVPKATPREYQDTIDRHRS
jgi:hypothetical protein